MQKVSPQKTPMVVGKLLDLDCSEDFIRQLLNSVGHQCPVDELVEQVGLDMLRCVALVISLCMSWVIGAPMTSGWMFCLESHSC